MFKATQGISCTNILKSNGSTDITGFDDIAGLLFIGMHLEQSGNTLLFAGTHIQYVRASINFTGINTDKAQASYEWIGSNFKCQRSQWLID